MQAPSDPWKCGELPWTAEISNLRYPHITMQADRWGLNISILCMFFCKSTHSLVQLWRLTILPQIIFLITSVQVPDVPLRTSWFLCLNDRDLVTMHSFHSRDRGGHSSSALSPSSSLSITGEKEESKTAGVSAIIHRYSNSLAGDLSFLQLTRHLHPLRLTL